MPKNLSSPFILNSFKEVSGYCAIPCFCIFYKLLPSVSPAGLKLQNSRSTKYAVFSLSQHVMCFAPLMGRLSLLLLIYHDILVTCYLGCRVCGPCIIMPCSPLLSRDAPTLFKAGKQIPKPAGSTANTLGVYTLAPTSIQTRKSSVAPGLLPTSSQRLLKRLLSTFRS